MRASNGTSRDQIEITFLQGLSKRLRVPRKMPKKNKRSPQKMAVSFYVRSAICTNPKDLLVCPKNPGISPNFQSYDLGMGCFGPSILLEEVWILRERIDMGSNRGRGLNVIQQHKDMDKN